MTITIGQTVLINGEKHKVARLLMPSAKVITTAGEVFYAD